MTDQNAPKRKQGHPPWTEEQKQARRELNAQKRADAEAAERAAEQEYAKKRKRGRPPWTEADHAKNAATWAKKRAKRDEERKALIAANPGKTKKELGLNYSWKPADGSDSGYRRVMLKQARVGISLPPIDIKDPKQVEQRICEYFDFCESADKLPNGPGMANWLGVSKSTLHQWRTGAVNQATHTPIIQRAYSVMEEILVDSVQGSKKADIGGMFILKTTFGYKEDQDVPMSDSTQNDQLPSVEEIKRIYLNDGKTVETTFADEQKGDGGE